MDFSSSTSLVNYQVLFASLSCSSEIQTALIRFAIPINHFSASNNFLADVPWSLLGGMAIAVLPWVFRNLQEMSSMHFSALSPYYVGSSGGSPRQRQQEMEVEGSLHQIWVFLFCCAMLCLLLF